jgi:hypothetical protein
MWFITGIKLALFGRQLNIQPTGVKAMPFDVSDLIIAGSAVVGLVAVCWIVAKMLDRRSDVLRYIDRDHSEP